MTPQEFRAERKKLERAIKAQIAPLLYPTAYCLGNIGESRPLLVWVPRDKKGNLSMRKIKLKGGLLLREFEGFTEEGAIYDTHGNTLSTMYWKDIPIEDLFRLNKWMTLMLPMLSLNDKATTSSGNRKSEPLQPSTRT